MGENEAAHLKERGNEAFKKEEWDEALSCYTQGLKLLQDDEKERAVLYKNRAAVHLKQDKCEKAVQDCNKSLEITPTDPKTLFRRAQALERLERQVSINLNN